ncbi:hypothetical protein O3M35_009402 [Rhynocoris fuscipes]|uniref:Pre-C2HC domain-containing protein n=1 Tax=Rhynocoris fuscipes TaxID=488301 RepID=A0AAW1D2S5_9HEMI
MTVAHWCYQTNQENTVPGEVIHQNLTVLNNDNLHSANINLKNKRRNSSNQMDMVHVNKKKNKTKLRRVPLSLEDLSNLTQPRPSTSAATPPSFCTPNPYAILTPNEGEADSDANNDNTQSKTPKPPPIYINNLTNYANFCATLSSILGPNSFECKSRINNVMLLTKSIDGYRAAIRYLSTQDMEYHTYQIKSEKAFRVVLRHLHHTIDTSLIKEELEERGYKVRCVTNVRHPVTKTALPLFFVDLEPSEKNKEIFTLRSLVYSRVTVEEPHKTIEIIQCKRCQQYGHSRTYCNHQPRCVRCGQLHPSSACQKPREDPPTCALCQGNHPANYKGCITHKELQRLRKRNFMNKNPGYQHTPAPSVTQANFPPLQSPHQPSSTQQPQANITSSHHHPNLSTFATVAGSPAPQPAFTPSSSPSSPISTDLTTLLSSFISDFKNLITPLISLLTSLVSNLIPKLTQ